MFTELLMLRQEEIYRNPSCFLKARPSVVLPRAVGVETRPHIKSIIIHQVTDCRAAPSLFLFSTSTCTTCQYLFHRTHLSHLPHLCYPPHLTHLTHLPRPVHASYAEEGVVVGTSGGIRCGDGPCLSSGVYWKDKNSSKSMCIFESN